MAREYLGDGADPAAQAEIARLLDGIVFTIDRLDAMAEIRAVRNRLSQDVAGRDVRHPVNVRDPLRLGALAGPLRPQNQNPHGTPT